MTIPPKYQTYLNVLLPSANGALLYTVASILFVGLQALNASTNTGVIQVEHIWFHHLGLWFTRTANHLQQVVGTQRLDNVVVYSFWGGLGILIWLLVRATSKNMGEFVDNLSLRDYIWPSRADRNRPLTQFLERGLFRLVIFILLLIYLSYVPNFLLQTGHRVVTNGGGFTLNLIDQYALLIIEWMVGWQMLTILGRLFFLKDRLGS